MKRLTLILLMLPTFAFADPGAATRYLMNEPASLMDIGLLKSQLDFADRRELIKRSFFTLSASGLPITLSKVRYDKTTDKIRVSYLVLDRNEYDLKDLVERCNNSLSELRSAMFNMPSWFMHDGYSRGSQTVPSIVQVIKIIEFECKISSRIKGRRLSMTLGMAEGLDFSSVENPND